MARLAILILTLGSLAIFGLQNRSPVLPLVFFGIQTQALPLGLWILMAIACGAATSLFLALISGLANYWLTRQVRRQVKATTGIPRRPEPTFRPFSTSQSQRRPDPVPPPEPEEALDDYFDQAFADDEDEEDEFLDEPVDRPPPRPEPQRREAAEPKPNPRSAAVYTYNAKDTQKTGVGKREAVFDAEFRVITPPYTSTSQPPPPRQPEPYQSPLGQEDDDWGLEDEDEEFADEDSLGDERPRR